MSITCVSLSQATKPKRKIKVMITVTQLRDKVSTMTINEMVNLRDELEGNWSNELRPAMNVLSLACIKRFNKTLSSL
jgi:hypothetical protein